MMYIHTEFPFTVGDACKRCCRMSLNETCFPIDPQDILPDGTPCIQGFCNKVIRNYYYESYRVVILK